MLPSLIYLTWEYLMKRKKKTRMIQGCSTEGCPVPLSVPAERDCCRVLHSRYLEIRRQSQNLRQVGTPHPSRGKMIYSLRNLQGQGRTRAGHVSTFFNRSVLERGPSARSFRPRSFFGDSLEITHVFHLSIITSYKKIL